MTARDPATPGPHPALLDLAEAAAAHPDPPALLRHLAARLRAVVPFDFLGVLLHDPAADVLRLTVFVSDDPDPPRPCPPVAAGASPSWVVWQTQEPALVPDLGAAADEYPAMRAVWDDLGMRSA